MPTINQLVNHSRQNKIRKTNAPALSLSFNSLHKKFTNKDT